MSVTPRMNTISMHHTRSAVIPASVVINGMRYVDNGTAFQFNVTNATNSVRTTPMVGKAKISRVTTVLAS